MAQKEKEQLPNENRKIQTYLVIYFGREVRAAFSNRDAAQEFIDAQPPKLRSSFEIERHQVFRKFEKKDWGMY
jgi:hypothetical protein